MVRKKMRRCIWVTSLRHNPTLHKLESIVDWPITLHETDKRLSSVHNRRPQLGRRVVQCGQWGGLFRCGRSKFCSKSKEFSKIKVRTCGQGGSFFAILFGLFYGWPLRDNTGRFNGERWIGQSQIIASVQV